VRGFLASARALPLSAVAGKGTGVRDIPLDGDLILLRMTASSRAEIGSFYGLVRTYVFLKTPIIGFTNLEIEIKRETRRRAGVC
jgi:hypothetical protein